MTTAARASGPRLRVLRALHDSPVEDRAGRAVHRLCQAARFDRQDALAQVLARMDHEGLIRREVQGRRTYLIEITDAGRRLAGLSRSDSPSSPETAATPSRLRFDALPPGPASTWNRPSGVRDDVDEDAGSDDPVVETHGFDPPRLIPAALREVAGDAAADIDYEVLAAVLLQTTLRALRGGEAGSRTGEPEPGVESLRAEIAADRSRIMDLEAQVRILEHNNRTLTEALARRQASLGESPAQRDLAHLMAQKPTARG